MWATGRPHPPARTARPRAFARMLIRTGSEKMVSWKIKIVVATLAVATLGQMFPQDADAFIFRWMRRRRAERIAYYSGCAPAAVRPTVAGFAPSPCGSPCGTTCNACPTPCTTTQRVCQSVPQTCYRTVYRQVPVTVYRPVSTVDPCTGCARTTMHPCTTVQHVAQRVPVTTYRQVCQTVQRPVAPTCNPCAPAAPVVQQYAPVQQYAAPVQQYAPASPGCTSCGSPQIPTAQPYAAVQPYQPAPAAPMNSVAPQPTPAGPTTSLAPSNGGNAPANTIPSLPNSTYQSNPPANSQIQGSSARTSTPFQPRVQNPDIRPLPDLERAPPLLNPDDRAASRIEPGTIMPISWQTPAAPQEKVYSAPTNYTPVQNNPVNYAKPKTRRLDASGWVPAGTF